MKYLTAGLIASALILTGCNSEQSTQAADETRPSDETVISAVDAELQRYPLINWRNIERVNGWEENGRYVAEVTFDLKYGGTPRELAEQLQLQYRLKKPVDAMAPYYYLIACTQTESAFKITKMSPRPKDNILENPDFVAAKARYTFRKSDRGWQLLTPIPDFANRTVYGIPWLAEGGVQAACAQGDAVASTPVQSRTQG